MPSKKSSMTKSADTLDILERAIAEAGLDESSAPLSSMYPAEPTDPGSLIGGKPAHAPFQYFGGKAPVAHLIWQALGADVDNYMELFAGSAAVLLARPPADDLSKKRFETLNDADGFIVNCLRA